MSEKALVALERYASAMVRKIEHFVQPGRMEIFAGPPVFCLAVAIALPIPFGNLAPVAALCIIAIGLIERDGLVVLLASA